VLKQGAAKAFFGAKLFGEWLGHEKIRTVELADVQREAAAAQAQGGGGLADAIGRYVYLYPSSTAWDSHTSQQVALSDLRNAIADCYDQWLKHPKRRNMPKENLVFDPTQQVVTGEYINTFRGLPLVPVRNDDACRNMRHMLWCLCNKNDEIFTWICQWLAFPLQHVGAKMQTAVLMHSRVHGSGKSFFFDGVMRAVYGEYCRTFGQAELESQYNDWISQALFGVFEEVLSRSQRYSHTGTLKQMITGEKVRINQKYMQGWEESNHLNCVFLSNEVEPLPVEPSDRRLLVIWPEEKLLDELQTGVDAELKAGGAAAFYDWLLRVDTSNFTEHAKPPMTDAKKRLIDIGRPAWEVFYEDWKNLRTDAPYCSCRVIDLYRLYQGWAKMRNENVLAMNRFSGYIASYERRRPDLHYEQGSLKGKSSFFIVGQCPAEKNQSEWLAGCVGEFDRILRVDHQDAA
jgi:putative DNA primase/helicase